jgi:hypothetical protein
MRFIHKLNNLKKVEEVVKVGDFDVLRDPSNLEDGDEVISFRTKTIDTIKKSVDGRFVLSNATALYNWPVHFNRDYYGKILKN